MPEYVIIFDNDLIKDDIENIKHIMHSNNDVECDLDDDLTYITNFMFNDKVITGSNIEELTESINIEVTKKMSDMGVSHGPWHTNVIYINKELYDKGLAEVMSSYINQNKERVYSRFKCEYKDIWIIVFDDTAPAVFMFEHVRDGMLDTTGMN
ncbi:hypothetical protein K502DRAFT_251128 [Neoconidiobolus thromboides FSU 785]|nr:hypothetical protein K502DRAFT_251128 [Neoconidiobolus thromboides FSU 785]